MKKYKLSFLLLSLVLVIGLFCACGTDGKTAEEDPSVLPDFLATGKTFGFYQRSSSDSRELSFRTEEDDVRDMVETYVQQLLDMGYEICGTKEIENQYMDLYGWYLSHPQVAGSTVEGGGQIYLKYMLNIPYKSKDRYTTVNIFFGDGISYAGTIPEKEEDSSSSSPVPDYDPPDSTIDCPYCDGSGDCSRCYGSCFVYYGDARSTCPTCHGDGKCTRCHGSGKR